MAACFVDFALFRPYQHCRASFFAQTPNSVVFPAAWAGCDTFSRESLAPALGIEYGMERGGGLIPNAPAPHLHEPLHGENGWRLGKQRGNGTGPVLVVLGGGGGFVLPGWFVAGILWHRRWRRPWWWKLFLGCFSLWKASTSLPYCRMGWSGIAGHGMHLSHSRGICNKSLEALGRISPSGT